MSFDCGFDIFPSLPPPPENKTRDADFPNFLDKRFIHFVLTNNPRIPANPNNCDLFLSLRTSSVFDAGTLDSIKEITSIARHHFGSRVHFWTNQSDIYTRGEVNRAEWEISKRKDASDSQ